MPRQLPMKLDGFEGIVRLRRTALSPQTPPLTRDFAIDLHDQTRPSCVTPLSINPIPIVPERVYYTDTREPPAPQGWSR